MILLVVILLAAWAIFGISGVISDYNLSLQKPELKDGFRRFGHHMLVPVIWIGDNLSAFAKRVQSQLKK